MKSTSALVRTTDQSKTILAGSYLRFKLSPKTSAVFPMRHVLEAMTLPTHQLTLMPNCSPCMIGLMNRRNRVLWVVSLMHLLGLEIPNTFTQDYTLIIVQVHSVSLALAVHQVTGMLKLEKSKIQPPPGSIATSIVPYLSGCIFQQKVMLLVLDVIAIINSSRLSE